MTVYLQYLFAHWSPTFSKSLKERTGDPALVFCRALHWDLVLGFQHVFNEWKDFNGSKSMNHQGGVVLCKEENCRHSDCNHVTKTRRNLVCAAWRCWQWSCHKYREPVIRNDCARCISCAVTLGTRRKIQIWSKHIILDMSVWREEGERFGYE